MERDPRAYLWDALESAVAIQKFTHGMDAATYALNDLVQAAVERKFEIIGESLNRLSKVDMELASRISNLAQIVAFRNQLAHGYASVRHQTVWKVIQDSIPGLIERVRSMQAELGSD